MRLGAYNRILLLGVGLLLAVALLLGGMHHHDGDEACWFCITVAASVLPLIAIALALLIAATGPIFTEVAQAPTWFLWLTHLHRGPPALY